ncbi:MAG: DegV family protein [Clostridium sp.]
MNNKYKIVAGATCDLSAEIADNLDITVIPMPLIINDNELLHHYDYREISLSDFYNKLREGEVSKTSQINMTMFMSHFESILKDGYDILYLGFSSGLSGTVQSANLAIEELKELYPERKIYCVDTLCASVGEGLFVYSAAKKREEGYSLEELVSWAEENKLNLCHYFTVDDLNFLHRGGRLSKTAAIAGSILSIKPILHVDNEGHLAVIEKARGTKKAVSSMINHLRESSLDLENQTIFVGHGDDIEGATKLKELILKENLAKEVIILPVGPVIGSHAGPGLLAILFFGDKR